MQQSEHIRGFLHPYLNFQVKRVGTNGDSRSDEIASRAGSYDTRKYLSLVEANSAGGYAINEIKRCKKLLFLCFSDVSLMFHKH
jgi:hypothetical protein